MSENFEIAMQYLPAHEGGWSDHRLDPGGATNLGITLRVWRRYCVKMRWPRPGKAELRRLQWSDPGVRAFYYSEYWVKAYCNELPNGLDYIAFDAAVNSGPRRSIKWWQRAIGTKPDGVVGPNTRKKLQSLDGAQTERAIRDAMVSRMLFWAGLSIFGTFGRGWFRRGLEVHQTARAMRQTVRVTFR